MSASSVSEAPGFPSRAFDVIGSLRRRLLLSIGATVGWICLTLLYLAFWAHGFTLVQSIVVIVVSLLVLGAILVGAWISFGLRFVHRWSD